MITFCHVCLNMYFLTGGLYLCLRLSWRRIGIDNISGGGIPIFQNLIQESWYWYQIGGGGVATCDFAKVRLVLGGLVSWMCTPPWSNKVSSRTSLRHGRLCETPNIPTSAPANIRQLIEGSFCVQGTKLFNAIPKSIRNLSDVDVLTFKKKLDEFLSSIADEPQSPGYTARRRADSNSLLHMIPVCNKWLELLKLWTLLCVNVVLQYNVGFY